MTVTASQKSGGFSNKTSSKLPFRFWFPWVEKERGGKVRKKKVMTMIMLSSWGLKQFQGDAAYTNKQFRDLKPACTPYLPLKTFS